MAAPTEGGTPRRRPASSKAAPSGAATKAATGAATTAATPSADESVAPGMRIAAAWSWRLLVVAGAVALVLWLIAQLRYIAIPFFVAILLSALLVPFANWLQKHRWPKWLAVVVCEVGVIAVVAGLVTLVVIQVRSGFPSLQQRSLVVYDDFTAFLLASPLHLTEADINTYVGEAFGALQSDTSFLIAGARDVGGVVGHILAGALLALFTTLFILIDGRGMWNWFTRLFPQRARPAVVGGGEAGWITLTTFVKVQIFVAFVDAVGIGLGAWIIGLAVGQPFPLLIPIMVAVFLGSFIPVIGAVVTGAIAVFVALVYLGPIPALIMLGVVLLVQQLEGHVLQPLVIGAAIKIHPVAVVLAVATGGFVAGIPGALFAVPTVAVLNVVVGYIARGEWRTNPHPDVSDVATPVTRRTRRAG